MVDSNIFCLLVINLETVHIILKQQYIAKCWVTIFSTHGVYRFYYISRESWTTRNVLWSRASVCLSLCLPVRGRVPTLLHRPGCNLGQW